MGARGRPAAVLYLNDYDILTGKRLDDYVVHIRRFLTRAYPLAVSAYRDIYMATPSIRPHCSRPWIASANSTRR